MGEHGGNHHGRSHARPWSLTKITSEDVIPQRSVLRVPQMAEQLVDEPMPSFDDFELVEEEEEEEQPSTGYTARPGRYRNTGRRGDSGG